MNLGVPDMLQLVMVPRWNSNKLGSTCTCCSVNPCRRLRFYGGCRRCIDLLQREVVALWWLPSGNIIHEVLLIHWRVVRMRMVLVERCHRNRHRRVVVVVDVL
ncbi:hypothetical protein HanPSC8_Chr08g0313741 [Helianthus annuus]|nr:hypothetical protein HanPSC8_Chr08g0313741 [Helianthus annuus]